MSEKFQNFEQPHNTADNLFKLESREITSKIKALHDQFDRMSGFDDEESKLWNKYIDAGKDAFPDDFILSHEQLRTVMSPEDRDRAEEMEKQINEVRAKLARVEFELLQAIDLNKLSLENIDIKKNMGQPGAYADQNFHSFKIPLDDMYSIAVDRYTAEADGYFASGHNVATYIDMMSIRGERKSGKRTGLLRTKSLSEFPSLGESTLSVEVAQEDGRLLTSTEESDLLKSHGLNKFFSPDEMALVHKKLEQLMRKLLEIKGDIETTN